MFCGIHYALPEKKKRALQIGALCGSLLLAAGVIIWYILKLQGSDFAEWGNHRGMLWQMAWQGFCRGDLKQKLLGVCEAEQRMNQKYNTDTHEESIEAG